MILVYDQILDRVKEFNKYKAVYAPEQCKPLIENFKEENLQSASYDVTISNTIMKQINNFKTIHTNNKVEIDSLFEEYKITQGYVLAPEEYILVKLNEKINMPDDLAGHLRSRTTFNKIGLVITSQHVNPSYNGHLQFGLKNTTNSAIEIAPNVVIGQLVSERLDDKVRDDALYRNKVNAKYQGESDFVKSKVYDEKTIKEVEEIYKKLLNS